MMNDFTKVQHGFMEHPKNKHWFHARKCNIHGHHGPLFICPYYSRQLKNKIRKISNICKKNTKLVAITNE